MVSIKYKAYCNNLEQKGRNFKSEKLWAVYFYGLKGWEMYLKGSICL